MFDSIGLMNFSCDASDAVTAFMAIYPKFRLFFPLSEFGTTFFFDA